MNYLLPALLASTMLVPMSAQAREIGEFGFDVAGMDRAVAPGEDFYRYANGGWEKATAIPADRSNIGAFTKLQELSEARKRTIIEEAGRDPSSRIGRAYAAFMDEAGIEAKGLAPIGPWLDRIRVLGSKSGYAALAAEARRNGVGGVFGVNVGQDSKYPERYIAGIGQSGLGLPDRDYYLADTPEMKSLRDAYVRHVATMLTLAGERDAEARAARLLAFETEIARVHWTNVESRDVDRSYNKRTLAALQAEAPGFDFAGFFAGMTERPIDALIVYQPSAVAGIAALVSKADLALLKDQLLIRSLDGFASYLPKAFVEESFAFYGTRLSGTPQLRPRWKRGVGLVEGMLGEELGKTYVARHFPPETKAKIDTLVSHVRAAWARRIDALAWMAPETKVKAQAKLAAFVAKIGYPETWRDYSGLVVKSDDLVGNVIASNRFDHDYEFARLGKPVDRREWAMTPQTVNAYANPVLNEIVFPAAILQPPFFDPEADPAVNYGAIGAVIGHEMAHHFDDQGSRYDAQGRLADWWSATDIEQFKALTGRLVAQYDAYEPLPGVRVKGQLTLGENIADLAGIAVARDAWLASLEGKAAPVIGGFTGEQRFWLGFAQVWRQKMREDSLRQQVLTDPHSPAPQRSWTARNFDGWYEAFAVKPGDRLYLAPSERVRIW